MSEQKASDRVKIELGKIYMTRRGAKVKIIWQKKPETKSKFPFIGVLIDSELEESYSYRADGRENQEYEKDWDIVREAPEQQPTAGIDRVMQALRDFLIQAK